MKGIQMKKFLLRAILVLIALGVGIGFYKTSKDPQQRVVAIATLVSHPALDGLVKNLKEQLALEGFREGENIKIEFRNASGQVQLASGISSELAALNPAVSVGVTTPIAQAMAKVTKGPFVFAAVTDPVGAGIVKGMSTLEPLVTGAADAWPYNDQLKLIREIKPSVKRLAVIFNPGDTASQFGMKEIRKYAGQLGFEILDGPVSSTSEVFSVTENIASDADAIFLSSDATAISGVAAAAKVAIKRQIPLFVGDSGTVEKGGLAAVSVSYDRLGVETGKLVARFLRGERNIPIVNPDGQSNVIVNTKAAELMGLEIPKSVLQRATIFRDIKQ
jgi:putative tryptophan/tyrosine transport system substrate-binding protein